MTSSQETCNIYETTFFTSSTSCIKISDSNSTKKQNIFEKIFFKYPTRNDEWNWSSLSVNPNITLEIVQQNPDQPWEWTGLSMNPNITWEFIQQNLDKPWDWNIYLKTLI